jgi:flagellum-specific peptidoglycan hydrolase FlgJ
MFNKFLTQQGFIDFIVPLAIADEAVSQVPAEVTVGQAIQESAWGKSALSVSANNYFGIKANKDWKGETVPMRGFEIINGKKVTEMMNWRKYNDVSDSVRDHSNFLKKDRYKSAFKTSNWQDFLQEIHQNGYATDPHYVADIVHIVTKYGIDKQCEELRHAK